MFDPSLTDEHPVTHELLAFIEIPKGSRNKYELDEGIGQVVLDRFLSSSMVYPTDYGFLMGHRGRDGDPLKMRDEKGEDDKIVCVPTHDPGWNTAETLDDIPAAMQREITHFFSVYKLLEDKAVDVDGWRSREEALDVIADARRLQMEHDAPRRS